MLLWEWFRLEGWVVVLACLNLLLVVRVLFWSWTVAGVAKRIEARYAGLQDRVTNAVHLATRVSRAQTSETPRSDPQADTHIRDLPES